MIPEHVPNDAVNNMQALIPKINLMLMPHFRRVDGATFAAIALLLPVRGITQILIVPKSTRATATCAHIVLFAMNSMRKSPAMFQSQRFAYAAPEKSKEQGSMATC